MIITDVSSFLAGVQVGRRLKVADAKRDLPKKPVPSGWNIITETGIPIISEAAEWVITEEQEG